MSLVHHVQRFSAKSCIISSLLPNLIKPHVLSCSAARGSCEKNRVLIKMLIFKPSVEASAVLVRRAACEYAAAR